MNVPVGVAVAAVLTGTVKPFGATLKKASKKFFEANFLYLVGSARGC
jgi:tyrosine-protein phosphatase YwqE